MTQNNNKSRIIIPIRKNYIKYTAYISQNSHYTHCSKQEQENIFKKKKKREHIIYLTLLMYVCLYVCMFVLNKYLNSKSVCMREKNTCLSPLLLLLMLILFVLLMWSVLRVFLKKRFKLVCVCALSLKIINVIKSYGT